ncbi:Timeless protein, partial [Trinorchestia longiramus]
MAQAIVEAELVAACSSLGYSDGGKYVRDPECVEIIRDLLRYLRRDDSSHQIRLALGENRVLQTDLLPLLREHHSDGVLLDLVLRLVVNLTTPALLVFHQEIPEDKAGRELYLRLISQQQGFKEAFTEAGVWASVTRVLGSRLQQGSERDDDANLVVEMCLVLLRNVLAVAPGHYDTTRTSDDADLHDQ